MKKLITIVMMCAGGILALPSQATAASCQNTDCASLGYSKSNVVGCEFYLYCPFDTSYKACGRYKDEYPLSTCPDGAICESKYRFDSCKIGYVKKGDICESSLVDSGCKIGYEQGTDKSGKIGCHETVCKISGEILVIGVNNSATLADGSKVIISCNVGTTERRDSNNCITSCVMSPIKPPVEDASCPIGTFKAGTSMACACTYGHESTSTPGCYTCCDSTMKPYSCMFCFGPDPIERRDPDLEPFIPKLEM